MSNGKVSCAPKPFLVDDLSAQQVLHQNMQPMRPCILHPHVSECALVTFRNIPVAVSYRFGLYNIIVSIWNLDQPPFELDFDISRVKLIFFPDRKGSTSGELFVLY